MMACAIRFDSTFLKKLYCDNCSLGGVILSLASMNRMIPPKMAIHTIHVRGGTRNSPFFEDLSSSLYFSSAMCQLNPGQLSMVGRHPNEGVWAHTAPLPAPD